MQVSHHLRNFSKICEMDHLPKAPATLMRQRFEPGTKEAFKGYVACLHQLYLMGAAMQLKRMGYHMTKIN